MRLLLCVCACAIAGCAPAASLPVSFDRAAVAKALTRATPATFETLHSFNGSDGAYPESELLAAGGKLYGTTFSGGTFNAGVVFEIDGLGNERVLHEFHGGPKDGQGPYAGLVMLDGELYGATTAGGYDGCSMYGYPDGCGTIFAVTESGRERIVYRFKGQRDGSTPQATLIALGGTLYGTAASGGAAAHWGQPDGCGVVFEVTPAGRERVLYRFTGGPDGGGPVAKLLADRDKLLSVTLWGGDGAYDCNLGCGTVFELGLTGGEQTLYQFRGGVNPSKPWAGLVADGDLYYGTTLEGGKQQLGTVFTLSSGGTETILHSFGGGATGGEPKAGLTLFHGLLYGAASTGVGRSCFNDLGSGCGLLFDLSTSGAYNVLYRFDGRDGSSPQGNLTPLGGALYGTTFAGGAENLGTVYRLTPPKLCLCGVSSLWE